METAKDMGIRRDHQQFARDIREHTKKRGWHNTAKVLREVVSVHVGWDSDFTELSNVLRRIEREFKDQVMETKPDIPNLPDGSPADHFS